ncbi:Uncharacterised protein [Mycobacteroides abscessus subsp. abscessus]|nr:Uncharacterised protein [Mycobacteroides abscessus subsp. abscessus]
MSHATRPAATSRATTVAPIGLDSEASWNTVSGPTGSPVVTSRTPNPLL